VVKLSEDKILLISAGSRTYRVWDVLKGESIETISSETGILTIKRVGDVIVSVNNAGTNGYQFEARKLK